MASRRKRQTRTWLQKLQRNPQVLLVLAALLGCLLVIALTWIPGVVKFETRLVATQLSFTTTDEQKPFLRGVPISEIIMEGQHEQPLILAGEFLNSPFQGLSELTIELPEPDSRIIVRPRPASGGEGNSEIRLAELELIPGTTVSDLSYYRNSRRLNLALNQAVSGSGNDSKLLRLSLGQQPLQIELEGCRLSTPDGALQVSDSNQFPVIELQPLSNTWQPQLPMNVQIILGLAYSADIETGDWFWGDLGVKDVRFVNVVRTGEEISEEVLRSTIQQGTIRMLDETLPLEEDQFLIVKKPGIQRLRAISILADRGFDILAVGKTSEVQVGLDPDFPIQGISANVWEQLFSPKAVVALLSFTGAMVATLLSWLINNLFKASQNGSN